jgi:tight adherence protein B
MATISATAAALSVWLLTGLTTSAPVHVKSGQSRGKRLAALAVLVVGVAVLLPHGWFGPVLVVAAALGAIRLLWARRTAARLAETNASFMAEVCDLLAAELAAGRPPDAAMREAALTWPAMAPVADVSRLGGDVPEALREAALAPGAGELRLLAAAWTVALRTGGGLGTATRRVAGAVRREQATRRLVAGELASARATARLMAGLPVVALLMGSGAGADPWSFLLGTPAGLCCLAGGLGTGIAGVWWIEQIARAVES